MSKAALDAVVAQLEAGGQEIDIDSLLHPPPPRSPLQGPAALLDALVLLSGRRDAAEVLGELLQEGERRGLVTRAAKPSPAAPRTPGPPAPPADGAGIWLSPDEADVQHGQVWVIRTTGNGLGWGQIDGYDVRRGKKHWRAISLATRRTVQVKKVLDGSCPRIGGRRERGRR